ncbi:MAG: hypothetical protein Q4C12_04055 [Clostridia bacterium]|nr:hypothetical protein [Clostridia bacterium]
MKRIMHTVLFVLVLASMLCPSAFAENHDYVLDTTDSTKRVPIPKTYEVSQVIYNLGNNEFLNQAEDIFIDKNDYIYVADTGANRIVMLEPSGVFYRDFKGDGQINFSAPTGVYVDDDGDIFVADTGNSRVCHMTSEGVFVEEFIRPVSELLDDTFTFTPNKVFVSPTGLLYVIKGQNFLSIDANNDFQGYVGQTEVGFDLRRWLVRMFATAEQKAKTAKVLPESYSNFVVDSSGMIYATTLGTSSQIRKINSVGNNIFPTKVYGEPVADTSTGLTGAPLFVDIAVDENGIVSVLEQKGGKVYQYNQEGELLTAFGGKGTWKGVFDLPVSLAQNSEGKLYVLDRTLNNIQVFSPTMFVQLIKQAVTDYSNGKYDETLDTWNQVLKIDANYTLAHQGIGKVYIKEMQWEDAMQEYRLVEDRSGYSNAYGEHTHDIFRDNFTVVVIILVLLITAIILLYTRLKKLADKILEGEIKNEHV